MRNNNLKNYLGNSTSKYISFVCLFAVLIILYPHNYDRIQREINQAKWRIQNVAHYRYQLSIGCDCSLRSETPVTIEVLDGTIVSVVGVDGKLSDWVGKNSIVFGKDQTMEGLFGQIQNQIYKNDYFLQATYDGKYGFPQYVLLKSNFFEFGGGVIYRVSNFEVLP
jgi:hypothetical protein